VIGSVPAPPASSPASRSIKATRRHHGDLLMAHVPNDATHSAARRARLTFGAAAGQPVMKLAALALVTMLGLGGSAHADTVGPDGRPVNRTDSHQDHRPDTRPGGRPHGQLRQLLLERFDANHDGRLEPQERRRAARVLRRLARKLTRDDRPHGPRAQRARGMVRGLDANGDGVVGPGEMPPEAARKLRPLDQNGDGWLDDKDDKDNIDDSDARP
jgi:hypothetical protein